MGDHDDRLAELVDGAAQEVEHVAAGRRVEVAGRLVGEDHGGAGDQCPRDRDALLLAAGELGRAMGAPVPESDGLDQRLEPGGIGVLAGDPHRQQHVLLGGEDRQQVVALEDEADLRAPQEREVVVIERVEPRAGAAEYGPTVEELATPLTKLPDEPNAALMRATAKRGRVALHFQRRAKTSDQR